MTIVLVGHMILLFISWAFSYLVSTFIVASFSMTLDDPVCWSGVCTAVGEVYRWTCVYPQVTRRLCQFAIFVLFRQYSAACCLLLRIV